MAVKEIWHDDDNFIVSFHGGRWSTVFAFPISELEGGASLARMMNGKIRNTLSLYSGMIAKSEMRDVTSDALRKIRPVVDEFFLVRGIGAGPLD